MRGLRDAAANAATLFVGPCTVALAALALCSVACDGDGGRGEPEVGGENRPTRLLCELTVGEGFEASRDYQFFGIRAVEVGEDGTLWVLDGEGQSALLRQFDHEGRFLRTVGGLGQGPGEFRDPAALALLSDGRLALRDRTAPDRLTVYAHDGSHDATWRIPGWGDRGGGGSFAVSADTKGVVWVRFQGFRRPTGPRHLRPPPVFVRMGPDGVVLDTVPTPTPPDVPRDSLQIVRTRSGGGVSILGIGVPYQPRGGWGLSPSGAFAVYRTDHYRVEIFSPVALPETEGRSSLAVPSLVITRDVQPVPVSEAERRALRRTMEEEVERAGGARGVRIPEVPRFKPPIKGVRFGADGRVWVSVSIPSVSREGRWVDPVAHDVFEPHGTFLGRVLIPERLAVARSRGHHLWGVFRGEYGVESVHRYRILWN